MRKRILSCLMALALFLGVAGMVPARAVTYSGSCGDNLTYAFVTETETLTISGTGPMYNYESWENAAAPWYWARDRIKYVVVEDGVTRIGNQAFRFGAFTTITLPDSVTEIGYAAFYNSSLQSIEMSPNVRTIEGYAFAGTGISEIELPEGLEYIGGNAFEATWNLRRIVMPDSVTAIGSGAFFMSGIQTARLSEQLTVIPTGAFRGCASLESIVIPNSVTTIEYLAFPDCSALKKLTLSTALTDIGYRAFQGCNSLTDLIIPGSVRNIGSEAFDGGSLQAVYVLSTDCTIATAGLVIPSSGNALGVPGKSTIYGYENSTAAYFADRWGYHFVSLGEKATPFMDVPAGYYYTDPVLWAVEQGVTNGVDAFHFDPNATCTRAQVVTFLWRAMGCPEPERTENPFGDVSPTMYYYKPVLWAVEQGITNGVSADRFGPDSACTRAQVVTFLYRAEGEPAVEAAENPFSDVPADQYYSGAVLWAVERGVTNGATATTFAPDQTCTRGQIVTFLYRDLAE